MRFIPAAPSSCLTLVAVRSRQYRVEILDYYAGQRRIVVYDSAERPASTVGPSF